MIEELDETAVIDHYLTVPKKINEIIDWINKFEKFPEDIKNHEELHKSGNKRFIDCNEVEGCEFIQIGSTVYEKAKNMDNYIKKEDLKKFILDNKRKEVDGNMTEDIIECAKLFNEFNL